MGNGTRPCKKPYQQSDPAEPHPAERRGIAKGKNWSAKVIPVIPIELL